MEQLLPEGVGQATLEIGNWKFEEEYWTSYKY